MHDRHTETSRPQRARPATVSRRGGLTSPGAVGVIGAVVAVVAAWYRLRPAGFAAAPYVQGFDWRVDNGIILENVWLMPH